MCESVSRISSLQRWRLGGIYSPLGKTSRFIAVAIPDTSGKRGFMRVGKAQKRVCMSAESAASKGGGLGVFIAPLKD